MKIQDILHEDTIDEIYRKVFKGLKKDKADQERRKEDWNDIMGTNRRKYRRGHGGAWKQR